MTHESNLPAPGKIIHFPCWGFDWAVTASYWWLGMSDEESEEVLQPSILISVELVSQPMSVSPLLEVSHPGWLMTTGNIYKKENNFVLIAAVSNVHEVSSYLSAKKNNVSWLNIVCLVISTGKHMLMTGNCVHIFIIALRWLLHNTVKHLWGY